jgi:hypothetical protein
LDDLKKQFSKLSFQELGEQASSSSPARAIGEMQKQVEHVDRLPLERLVEKLDSFLPDTPRSSEATDPADVQFTLLSDGSLTKELQEPMVELPESSESASDHEYDTFRFEFSPLTNEVAPMCQDKKGKRCNHYCRHEPPLMLTKWKENVQFSFKATRVPKEMAKKIIMDWMGQRPGLAEKFSSIHRVKELPYQRSPDRGDKEPDIREFHMTTRQGTWFYARLARPFPENLYGDPTKAYSHLTHWKPAYHGSNMYTFYRTAVNGLSPGLHAGKGDEIGVYAYKDFGFQRCTRLWFYMVYSRLSRNCEIYVCPVWDLLINDDKTSVGSWQNCCKEGAYVVRGVYIHVLSGYSLKNCNFSVNHKWDDFLPEYEQMPNLERVW